MTAQFRAEFFNTLNPTNFGPPISQFLYAGSRGTVTGDPIDVHAAPYNVPACGSPGGVCPANVFYSATAGQILTTGQFKSRQIQFAVKLMF